MNDALLFLTRREYANAVRRRIRRLREPRYLLALGAALVYLIMLLPRRNGAPVPVQLLDGLPIETMIALLAGGLLYWGWMFADRRTPLEFTAAELTWLFPAPIPRRSLILYKLARWQLPLLFNSLLLTLLFSVEQSIGMGLRRVLAVWVLLATLRLHRLAASLVRSRWFEPRAARRWSPAVLPATAWLLVLGWAAVDASQATGLGDVFRQFAAHPAARLALLPLTTMVRPVFSTTAAGPWLLASLPALLLLGIHVLWVVRADAVFAEVATAAAGRGAETEIDLWEERRVRPAVGRVVVSLSAVGLPAWALLWKQFVPVLRQERARRILLSAAAAFGACLILRTVPTGELPTLVVAALTVVLGAIAVAGPQLVRIDLRRELPRWELLRSLPLSGREVLLGLGSATFVSVTLLQLAGMLLLLALDAGAVAEWPDSTGVWLARGALVLPPLNALGSVTALTGAVLFPAWSMPIARRGGLDALGTNLLTLAGYIAMQCVLVAPILLLGTLALGAEGIFTSNAWRLTAATLLAWLTAFAEVHLLLGWLGHRFDISDRAASGLS